MYKAILLLAVILMIGVVSIGCSESGLTEAEVKAIVQAEVASQLANIDDDISAEVTTQLAGLAGLDDIISNEAAEKLGLESSHIRRLLAKGEIAGKKLGRDWVVLSLEYQRKRAPKRKKGV